MNKMYYGDLFVRIILFLLFISSIIIFYERQITQLNDMYVNAENIKTDLESNIQGGIEAVKYMNTSAQLILENKKTMQLKFAPLVEEYNSKGNYAADHVFDKNIANEDKANIYGYGGFKKDRSTLQEIEMSLSLIRYFKLIKEQNKDFSWVYYYSNKDFVTFYPFVESKDFTFLSEYKNKSFMKYATPKMNPNKELFITPLYIDNGGLGLVVTLGMPLYDKEKFLGATELDMTLESQSTMLKRLDYLHNNSVLINKENEIIAINTIAKQNTKEIIKINSLVGNKIVNSHDTQGAVSLIDGKYVYIKKFTNAPWKLIYYKNSVEVILKSFFASLPPLLTMAFIFYFYKIYQRMQGLSIELKEQVAYSKIQADLLCKKSAEFRSFVENSPDIIIRYDCEGRRIYVNPTAEKLFGIPANEIVGKTPLNGSPNPSDVMFMEKLHTVIQTKIPFEFESEFTTSKGEKRWGNYRIFPEFDLNRNIISVLSIGRDITEHKRNEDLFNLKQSLLAQMGEMISMIAHQWRQPLGAISTTAGSLELKIELQAFDLETKEGRDKQNLYFKAIP